MFKPPGRELLKHIINLCFSHAIADPDKLNMYEPFSPEVRLKGQVLKYQVEFLLNHT